MLNMTHLAASVCGIKPRFAQTWCSQCGRETGPGDCGHSSCSTHGVQAVDPAVSDLDGLEEFEFITGNGLTLRCYLQYEDAIDGGTDSPSAKERADVMYAFVGLIDVFDLVERIPVMKAEIEAEYLAELRRKDAVEIAEFNRDMGRMLTEDRTDWAAA